MRVALALTLAVLCCPVAIAQVPKFTIVSITVDPTGPILPGGKVKLKVTVRNDGDTIPAGRRFDFAFTTSDALAIGQPTGTPALFFGYCPGATPVNMVCQCFAAWEKGQTVELETEVTAGTNARGLASVEFKVSSGTVVETVSVGLHVALGGPDLITSGYLDFGVERSSRPRKRGQVINYQPSCRNIGTTSTQGPWKLTASLSAGLNFKGDLSGIKSWTKDVAIPFLSGVDFDSTWITVNELGVQTVLITVSGGGDVDPSNNSRTFQFEVIREDTDPLNRLSDTEKLAEILGR